MLLKADALRNDVALHRLLLELALSSNLLVLLLPFFLSGKESTTGANGVHEFWLQKVVKGIQIEAFVQQFQVHFVG